MEYAPGGDLLDYINARRGGCGEDEARYIFQQIVRGGRGAQPRCRAFVAAATCPSPLLLPLLLSSLPQVLAVDYCHRVGVMNRDIKPEVCGIAGARPLLPF